MHKAHNNHPGQREPGQSSLEDNMIAENYPGNLNPEETINDFLKTYETGDEKRHSVQRQRQTINRRTFGRESMMNKQAQEDEYAQMGDQMIEEEHKFN